MVAVGRRAVTGCIRKVTREYIDLAAEMRASE